MFGIGSDIENHYFCSPLNFKEIYCLIAASFADDLLSLPQIIPSYDLCMAKIISFSSIALCQLN